MTDSNGHQQYANQQIEESLSALADGEATDLEVRRVLKACEENPELRRRWGRYQTISQVLSNGQALNSNSPYVFTDLSSRIKSSIADEPPINTGTSLKPSTAAVESTTAKRYSRNIWPDMGRFAIAASIAAVVVLGFQYTSVDQHPAAVAAAPESSIAPVDQVVYEGIVNKDIVQAASHSPDSSRASIQVSKQPLEISSSDLEKGSHDMQDLQRQLNRLMLEHVENASQNNYQGIMPYARIPSGE